MHGLDDDNASFLLFDMHGLDDDNASFLLFDMHGLDDDNASFYCLICMALMMIMPVF